MGPNQNHPDFPEYERRWKELWSEMEKEVEEVEAKEKEKGTPPTQDGPVGAVHKKYFSRIKALQQKYKHLYE